MPTDDSLPAGYLFKPDWELTPRQTAERLKTDPALLLLDCRRPDEFAVARIAGSTLIPMAEIEQRADELVADDGPAASMGKDRPIIVHCHHGVRSLRVASTLRGLGFTNVRSMAAGIDQWSVAIDPSVPRY
jgi:rhodanese-related sulfurtransferase